MCKLQFTIIIQEILITSRIGITGILIFKEPRCRLKYRVTLKRIISIFKQNLFISKTCITNNNSN